ncbi:antibiotic biosynthesis monooxygenase [Ramlibacter sp.]|uniref:putative quinol monooxygenase n=1 Tax=Ramlibacter sp. TaxID=1917967 RepID=UPI001800FC29|nr:antibiotic biosynthesis monooxygenase [Ramlibacter sp.]MBA2672268.1 antibiotic biosynthesis monooxygenase [Ramlibacter sp.]
MPDTARLVFYVKLFVKPECVQEWRAALDEIVNAMSQEEAFVSCHLHQDAQDETLFTLYERWAEPSVEAFVANQMKPYRIAYDTKLEKLLQRPREAQILVPLGAWHAS